MKETVGLTGASDSRPDGENKMDNKEAIEPPVQRFVVPPDVQRIASDAFHLVDATSLSSQDKIAALELAAWWTKPTVKGPSPFVSNIPLSRRALRLEKSV